ncbi:hypothetical protein Tco_0725590, partial [Tanacetum coccineum]
AEYAAAPTSSSPPPSLLTPISSPLPHIPSPLLPVTSPPTTSPTYVEAPLGYKAAEIRLKAALPSTHHPSEIPSPPLLLPYTSHREDVPEADVPPWKRLCLTAPTSRFEIWESLAAVAARQPGSSVAHRVDYGFIDTMDSSIQAAKERAMTAVRVVNLRVSYQTDVSKRESVKFYTHHQDTQNDRATVRAEIEALARFEAYNRALEAWIATTKTQLYRLEWQRQEADDHATGAMMRIHVLEARTHIDTLEDTGSSA